MSAIIPKATRLSASVWRILGSNPSPMTLQGTNTYVIGTGKRRLLVDAGEPNKPEYIDNLKKLLVDEGCELSDVIVTHWHMDHVGGVPDVLSAVVNVPMVHKLPRLDGPESDIGQVAMSKLVDGQIFEVEGSVVEVLHTPGHTADHVALYLKNDGVLLSADCILGEGTAVFEDLHSYMLSLQRILDLAPSQIYPGHGPVIEDPVSKIKYYIQHRLQREQQILKALEDTPLVTPPQLVQLIYKEIPSTLHKAAEVNVRHHLEKLRKDGKAAETDGSWRKLEYMDI